MAAIHVPFKHDDGWKCLRERVASQMGYQWKEDMLAVDLSCLKLSNIANGITYQDELMQ